MKIKAYKKCMYLKRMNMFMQVNITLFFNIVAVNIDVILQPWDEFSYSTVLYLSHYLPQTIFHSSFHLIIIRKMRPLR